jgi:hypothetical protein
VTDTLMGDKGRTPGNKHNDDGGQKDHGETENQQRASGQPFCYMHCLPAARPSLKA